MNFRISFFQEREGSMKIKTSQKLAYSFAGLALQASAFFIGTYMLIYLTDCIGMKPGIVGTILMVTKLFDGASDFVMGVVLDKTHTKIGKARPWIIVAALPLCLTVYMLFAVPESLSGPGQTAYVFIVYLLYSAVFVTMGSLSWNSLIALMTDLERERVVTASISSIISMVGCLAAVALTYPLVDQFGGGRGGWKLTAAIFAGTSLVFLLWAAFGVREQNNPDVNPDAIPEEKKVKDSSLPMKQLLGVLVRTRYFWIMLVFNIIYNFQSNVSSTGTFYAKYILGDESVVTLSAACNSIATFISIMLFTGLLKKITKQKALILGMALVTVSSVIKLIAPSSIPCYLIGGLFLGLGLGANVCSSGPLLADVVEDTFNRFGVRIEGLLFSCTSIGVKLGTALGSGMLGWLLDAAGYDGTLSAQPAGALRAIIVMTSVLPAILAVVCMAALKGMDVERKLPQYADRINARIFGKNKNIQ